MGSQPDVLHLRYKAIARNAYYVELLPFTKKKTTFTHTPEIRENLHTIRVRLSGSDKG